MDKQEKKYCPYCSMKLTDRYEGDTLRKYCESCKLFFYDNPLPVVSAVVLKERNILLVKRRFEPHQGKWCLPSGFAETGESTQSAAIRELEEETGLIGEITSFVDTDSVKDDFYGDLIFLTFEIEMIGGELKAGDDALEARYFSIKPGIFPFTIYPGLHFLQISKLLIHLSKTSQITGQSLILSTFLFRSLVVLI